MGMILAKFRKEKSTIDILEKLENEIKEIEEYSISTQARQKRYVGNFLLISIGFYVISCLIFFFLFFPPTWKDRILYLIPLLIFPLLIFLLKRLVAWYFQRKLNKNQTKLNALKSEKKKVLENVMDKETYKIAVEILNRFGDKNQNFRPTGAVTPRITTPMINKPSPIAKEVKEVQSLQLSDLIQRRLSGFEAAKSFTPHTPKTPNALPLTRTPNSAMRSLQPMIARKSTPFPIINTQEKTVVEKMVDYLIGDGPQNRFAMICKECHGHNGMAFQEDYEFAAFRCAFCNALNPAKKARPIAPKLPTTRTPLKTSGLKHSDSSSTSTSEKLSDSDEDFDEHIDGMKIQQPQAAKILPNVIFEKKNFLESNSDTTTNQIKNDSYTESESDSNKKDEDSESKIVDDLSEPPQKKLIDKKIE